MAPLGTRKSRHSTANSFSSWPSPERETSRNVRGNNPARTQQCTTAILAKMIAVRSKPSIRAILEVMKPPLAPRRLSASYQCREPFVKHFYYFFELTWGKMAAIRVT
jgi:hypothetical protein